jgi:3-carboxy-cis,cis-muconate cycloisomerase
MAIPEAFVLAAGALNQARFALGGLIVDEARMAKNLAMSNGLIVAEAVMMRMAPIIGRQDAHDIVYAACRIVNERGGTLADVLADDPQVSEHFDRAAIEDMTDPANYSGLAAQMVDRVLASQPR